MDTKNFLNFRFNYFEAFFKIIKNRNPFIYKRLRKITWCLEAESNHRHEDFQSSALPTELSRQIGDSDGTRTHDLRRDRAAF